MHALILATQITVSGISSGAYMAQQFHTAYSSQVNGVGIIAGGPYFCAKGKVVDALNRCMKTNLGLPKIKDSVNEAERLSGREIDPVSNIKHARVYALSGTNDETVLQKGVSRLSMTSRQLSSQRSGTTPGPNPIVS